MGTDMRGYLEYRQDDQWVPLANDWRLIRSYRMYGLLANVRGEGALYPPRGVPHDVASSGARKGYCLTTFQTDDEISRARGLGIGAIAHDQAEQLVAEGKSEWFDENRRQIAPPGTYGASWLTTTEFRNVIDYFEAHIEEYRAQDYAEYLAGMIARHGEEEGERLARDRWHTPNEPHDYVHIDFRILLAAMEAGEARGYPMRFIFWFSG